MLKRLGYKCIGYMPTIIFRFKLRLTASQSFAINVTPVRLQLFDD